MFNGLVYVPTRLRDELIKEMHKAHTYSHPRVEKILKIVIRNYYFPAAWRKVKEVVATYIECGRNKPARHTPYRLL